jgi:hypothetical protein
VTYDYKKAVKQDVKAYVRDNICLQDFDDVDELRDHLRRKLQKNDSVTGAGRGSYTGSAEQARSNLEGNLDLLLQAIVEFGDVAMRRGPEASDVCIRLQLLPGCIDEVLEDTGAEAEIESCYG